MNRKLLFLILFSCFGLAIQPLQAEATSADEADFDEVGRIQRAIELEGLSWQADSTALMRLPAHERQRYHMSIPDERPQPTIPTARTTSLFSSWSPAERNSQSSLDWRDIQGYNFITPVRDQGSCGACWAFGAVAAMEGLMAWRRSLPDPTIDLSEQHLVDCASSVFDCDTGGITWIITGRFMTDKGVTDEACYPYVSGQSGVRGECQPASEMDPACREAIVTAEDMVELYQTSPDYPAWDPPPYLMSEEAMQEIKDWLLERPVACSMRVYSDFYAYRQGVYEPIPGARSQGLHVVLIVGYDDLEEAWIIKNSWGDDWGDEGFARIRYDTSSIGMFSFVFLFDEGHAEPLMCASTPESAVLEPLDPEDELSITIANCGSGVMEWSAEIDVPWLELLDADDQPVTAGFEVATGSSYRIRLSNDAPHLAVGQLALSSSGFGSQTLRIETTAGPETGMPTADNSPAKLGCALSPPVQPVGSLATLLCLVLGLLALIRRRR